MIKEIKYEAHSIEDVILDLADEIKNGWNIYSFRYPEVTISYFGKQEVTVEIALRKE